MYISVRYRASPDIAGPYVMYKRPGTREREGERETERVS